MRAAAVCYLLLIILTPTFCFAAAVERFHGVSIGMSQRLFERIYPKKQARTYRGDGTDEWITFNEPLKGASAGMVTFHLHQGKVTAWRVNDRPEVIEEYMGEFCSPSFSSQGGMPRMYAAISDVLLRIPLEAFLKVTDRRHPVLFTEVYDAGTARFANTAEIISSEDDAPAFQGGMAIIKLSTAFNEAATPAPIEGVIAHELAHRVLEHVRIVHKTCDLERQANALVKQWGFVDEYKQASLMFGHREGDAASCKEDKSK
ncbi:MAG: hypothetical protein HQL22_01270 [Candidatus Omnitrophica bacterium]|nr:hypothetical protein [Candidatus Omnitrophota bacterium]